MMLRITLLILFSSLAPVHAQPDLGRPPIPPLNAVLLDEPVVLDGILSESVWQRPGLAPLTQDEPDNGAPPRQRTDWWIAYDKEALYFAARMYDSAPDSIVRNLGRRDTWPASDWIALSIDTFNDDRTGYTFGVNPAGVIGDQTIYNDGWTDDSWDPVWDCAAKIDELGWTAEMRIPFSQINFPNRENQTWGINLLRSTLRHDETDQLIHVPRGESGFCCRFPDLCGIRGIRAGRRLEVLPYGVAREEMLAVGDDPFRDDREFAWGIGTDLKWSPSSNLTLNGTLNPDFGQVEVDPAVVNLSDFESYFEERRPFFVHGANTFLFGQEGTNNNWNFNWMDPLMLYSRRIGRAPTLSLDDHDFADVPDATTILAAGKVNLTSGNTTGGFLSAFTQKETAELQLHGARSEQTAEPFTNYSILRVKRASPDGRRGLGFMATSTLRDLADADSREQRVRSALAGGIDGWLKLDADAEWALKGYFTASHVAGEAPAIASVQRSSRRYFQRPEADHIELDTTRTSLSGWIARTALNRQRGSFRLNATAGAISPGFEINDAGFQNRADLINSSLVLGYHWLEPKGIVRQRGFDLGSYYTWDFGGNPDERGTGLFYFLTFANYWHASGHLFFNPERQTNRFTRGGPHVRVPESRSLEFEFESNNNKPLVVELGTYLSSWGDRSSSARGWAGVRLLPLSALNVSVHPSYSWNSDRSAWVSRVEDPAMTATYGSRCIVGTLEYREMALTTRVDWTFTPKLTFQAYVQPLIASGRYSEFKELARPGTFTFNEYGHDNGSTIRYDEPSDSYIVDPDGPGTVMPFSFDDPDFNVRSLKVNTVLRWEYQPGSTIYLVWTQDRSDYGETGRFDFGRDWERLADAKPENIVLLKLTKWLNL